MKKASIGATKARRRHGARPGAHDRAPQAQGGNAPTPRHPGGRERPYFGIASRNPRSARSPSTTRKYDQARNRLERSPSLAVAAALAGPAGVLAILVWRTVR